MKKQIFILLGLVGFFAASCQKQGHDNIDVEEQARSISLNLSFGGFVDGGTDYEPITRAQSRTIKLSNSFQVYILEQRENGDYMVVYSSLNLFDYSVTSDALIDINYSSIVGNVITTLRPGTYEVIVFTNPYDVETNTDLVEGTIIPNPSSNPEATWAVKYKQGYANKYILKGEIFYGRDQLVINKSTELDTNNSGSYNITLNMERRVTKFRAILQETSQNNHDVFGVPYFSELNTFGGTPLQGAVEMEFSSQSGDQLPWGLDIWGNAWYDPSTNHTTLDYLCFVHAKPYFSDMDGMDYFIPTINTNSCSIYFLCDPNAPLEVKSQPEATVQWQAGEPMAVYSGFENNFTLENNTINGIVFRLTGGRVSSGASYDNYELTVMYAGGMNLLNPAELFEGNIEFAVNPDI